MVSWKLGLELDLEGCVGVQREREISGAEMKIQKQNWYGTVKRGGNMLGEFLLLNK